jgi:hypothetical protein
VTGGPRLSAQQLRFTFVKMTSAMRSEPLEVVLPRGVRIRVPTDFDASAMERLLDMLESRR